MEKLEKANSLVEPTSTSETDTTGLAKYFYSTANIFHASTNILKSMLILHFMYSALSVLKEALVKD